MAKRNIYLLKCACGLERETDIPLDELKPQEHQDLDLAKADPARCSRCGGFSWTQGRDVGKKIAKDKSAPLELIEQQEAANA